MLSIEETRKHLDNKNLTDKEVEEIRNGLYGLAEVIFEKWMQDKKNKRLKP